MGASEIAAIAGGMAAVLSSAGATLRYLLRLAASMERTAVQAADMSRTFARHVESSDELHRALTDRVTVHGEELAALKARLGGDWR